MVRQLNGAGQMIRSLFALGFGIFWGFCAYTIKQNGAEDSTVMGISAMAVVAGLFGLFGFMRGAMATLPKPPAALYDDNAPVESDGEFDPDAIIARHIARKGLAPQPAEPSFAPAPAAGGFGRKVV